MRGPVVVDSAGAVTVDDQAAVAPVASLGAPPVPFHRRVSENLSPAATRRLWGKLRVSVCWRTHAFICVYVCSVTVNLLYCAFAYGDVVSNASSAALTAAADKFLTLSRLLLNTRKALRRMHERSKSNANDERDIELRVVRTIMRFLDIKTLIDESAATTPNKQRKKKTRRVPRAGVIGEAVSDSCHAHPLILKSSVYAGLYTCNVCRLVGDGQAYSCSGCFFDVHPACLSKRASLVPASGSSVNEKKTYDNSKEVESKELESKHNVDELKTPDHMHADADVAALQELDADISDLLCALNKQQKRAKSRSVQLDSFAQVATQLSDSLLLNEFVRTVAAQVPLTYASLNDPLASPSSGLLRFLGATPNNRLSKELGRRIGNLCRPADDAVVAGVSENFNVAKRPAHVLADMHAAGFALRNSLSQQHYDMVLSLLKGGRLDVAGWLHALELCNVDFETELRHDRRLAATPLLPILLPLLRYTPNDQLSASTDAARDPSSHPAVRFSAWALFRRLLYVLCPRSATSPDDVADDVSDSAPSTTTTPDDSAATITSVSASAISLRSELLQFVFQQTEHLAVRRAALRLDCHPSFDSGERCFFAQGSSSGGGVPSVSVTQASVAWFQWVLRRFSSATQSSDALLPSSLEELQSETLFLNQLLWVINRCSAARDVLDALHDDPRWIRIVLSIASTPPSAFLCDVDEKQAAASAPGGALSSLSQALEITQELAVRLLRRVLTGVSPRLLLLSLGVVTPSPDVEASMVHSLLAWTLDSVGGATPLLRALPCCVEEVAARKVPNLLPKAFNAAESPPSAPPVFARALSAPAPSSNASAEQLSPTPASNIVLQRVILRNFSVPSKALCSASVTSEIVSLYRALLSSAHWCEAANVLLHQYLQPLERLHHHLAGMSGKGSDSRVCAQRVRQALCAVYVLDGYREPLRVGGAAVLKIDKAAATAVIIALESSSLPGVIKAAVHCRDGSVVELDSVDSCLALSPVPFARLLRRKTVVDVGRVLSLLAPACLPAPTSAHSLAHTVAATDSSLLAIEIRRACLAALTSMLQHPTAEVSASFCHLISRDDGKALLRHVASNALASLKSLPLERPDKLLYHSGAQLLSALALMENALGTADALLRLESHPPVVASQLVPFNSSDASLKSSLSEALVALPDEALVQAAVLEAERRRYRLGPDRVTMTCKSGNIQVILLEPGVWHLKSGSYFSTAIADCKLCSGKWYYQIIMETDQIMQIGFGSDFFSPDFGRATGVGDDNYSWGYDGNRLCTWVGGEQTLYSDTKWKSGDTVGVAVDLDSRPSTLKFFLNEQDLGVAYSDFNSAWGLIPALTLNAGDGINCRVIFDRAKMVRPPPPGYHTVEGDFPSLTRVIEENKSSGIWKFILQDHANRNGDEHPAFKVYDKCDDPTYIASYPFSPYPTCSLSSSRVATSPPLLDRSELASALSLPENAVMHYARALESALCLTSRRCLLSIMGLLSSNDGISSSPKKNRHDIVALLGLTGRTALGRLIQVNGFLDRATPDGWDLEVDVAGKSAADEKAAGCEPSRDEKSCLTRIRAVLGQLLIAEVARSDSQYTLTQSLIEYASTALSSAVSHPPHSSSNSNSNSIGENDVTARVELGLWILDLIMEVIGSERLISGRSVLEAPFFPKLVDALIQSVYVSRNLKCTMYLIALLTKVARMKIAFSSFQVNATRTLAEHGRLLQMGRRSWTRGVPPEPHPKDASLLRSYQEIDPFVLRVDGTNSTHSPLLQSLVELSLAVEERGAQHSAEVASASSTPGASTSGASSVTAYLQHVPLSLAPGFADFLERICFTAVNDHVIGVDEHVASQLRELLGADAEFLKLMTGQHLKVTKPVTDKAAISATPVLPTVLPRAAPKRARLDYWPCDTCTLHNDLSSLTCEACGSARPAAPEQKQQEASADKPPPSLTRAISGPLTPTEGPCLMSSVKILPCPAGSAARPPALVDDVKLTCELMDYFTSAFEEEAVILHSSQEEPESEARGPEQKTPPPNAKPTSQSHNDTNVERSSVYMQCHSRRAPLPPAVAYFLATSVLHWGAMDSAHSDMVYSGLAGDEKYPRLWSPGDYVDAQGTQWRIGRIVDVDTSGAIDKVIMHFEGWTAINTIVLYADSPRLAPYGSKTKANPYTAQDSSKPIGIPDFESYLTTAAKAAVATNAMKHVSLDNVAVISAIPLKAEDLSSTTVWLKAMEEVYTVNQRFTLSADQQLIKLCGDLFSNHPELFKPAMPPSRFTPPIAELDRYPNLKDLPIRSLQLRFALLQLLNSRILRALPYIDLANVHVNFQYSAPPPVSGSVGMLLPARTGVDPLRQSEDMAALYGRLSQTRSLLFPEVRTELWDAFMPKTRAGSYRPPMDLDRLVFVFDFIHSFFLFF